MEIKAAITMITNTFVLRFVQAQNIETVFTVATLKNINSIFFSYCFTIHV